MLVELQKAFSQPRTVNGSVKNVDIAQQAPTQILHGVYIMKSWVE